ncbi:MAG: hypothetical protein V2A79_10905 [Planctomycetota bacterium]
MAYEWEAELPALSALSDQEAANAINAMTKQGVVDSVSGQDLFEAVVPAEFALLTDAQKALLYAIVGMGTIRVNGTNTKTALLSMFAAGTTTRANLAVLQKCTVPKYATCHAKQVAEVRAHA